MNEQQFCELAGLVNEDERRLAGLVTRSQELLDGVHLSGLRPLRAYVIVGGDQLQELEGGLEPTGIGEVGDVAGGIRFVPGVRNRLVP
jgi:hypothetical protein